MPPPPPQLLPPPPPGFPGAAPPGGAGGFPGGGAAPAPAPRGYPPSVQPTLGSSRGATKPCSFFMTRAGCRNGANCPFIHDSAHVPTREELVSISLPGAGGRGGGPGAGARGGPARF